MTEILSNRLISSKCLNVDIDRVVSWNFFFFLG